LWLVGCKTRSQKTLERDFNAAQLSFFKGYIDQPLEIAQRGYQESSRYPDLHWRFRILLADLRIKQAKPSDALELLSASPEPGVLPDTLFRRRLVRAMAFCNSRSQPEAQAELSAAERELTASPQDATQLQLTGARCNQALGKFSQAYTQFGALQNSSTQDGFAKLYALLGMASCAVKQHHYEDALKWYLLSQQAAIALKAIPYEQVAQGNLGFLYFELGDFDQALKSSQAAVELTSHGGTDTYSDYWLLNLGRVYQGTAQFGLAKESYEKGLKLASSRGNDVAATRFLHNLVQAELRDGNIDKANEYHRQAEQLHVKEQEDLRDLRIDSAYLSVANGNYSVAEPELLKLVSEVQDNPRLKWRLEAELAQLYAKLHKPEPADQWFRKSIATIEEAAAHMQQTEFKIGMLDN
jgi:hypothetical protein